MKSNYKFKYLLIVTLLIGLVNQELFSQSLYLDQGDSRLGFQYSHLSSKPEVKGHDFLLSYSNNGRLDVGVSYGSVTSTYSFGNNFGGEFNANYMSPQVGYLIFKDPKGFSLGINTGGIINTSNLSEHSAYLVYGFTMSHRIGKINRSFILPFFAFSGNTIDEPSTLGGGISFALRTPEATGILIITPAFHKTVYAENGGTIFSIGLGYIFREKKGPAATG